MQTTPAFPKRDRPSAFLAGGIVAFLHPLIYGYVWGAGDQDELIPPVLARMNPIDYANDAFVQGQIEGGLTVRAAFQAVLSTLSQVMSPEAAAGVLHILTLFGVGVMVYSVSRALHARRSASMGATLLACLVVPSFTLGGNQVVYNLLTPEGIAWVPALAAITLFLRDHRFIAALVLGIASWLHVLVGFQTLLILGVAAVYAIFKEEQEKPQRTEAEQADYQMDYVLGRGRQRREPWKGWPALAFVGGTLGIALPVIWPALKRLSATGPAVFPEGMNIFRLFVELRHPHHLLPGAFGFGEWALFLMLLALGVGGFYLASRERRLVSYEFPAIVGLVFIALAVVATYAIYEADSLRFARLQPFKMTVLVNVMLCVGIGTGLLSLLPNTRRRALDDILRKKAPLYIAAVVLLFLGLRDTRSPEILNTRDVAVWARSETEPEALFIVPPSMDAFRVPSRRSAVVTWKSVPFRADLAAGWWARIADIAPLDELPETGRGLVERLDAAYAENGDAEWRALADKYDAQYAVVPAGTATAFPVVHTDANWSILDLQ